MPVSCREKKVRSPAVDSFRCSYSIVVRTSAESAPEIDAIVFVKLIDKGGRQTDKYSLRSSITHRLKFQKGHSDLFLIVDQPLLSDLDKVEVWMKKRSIKCPPWKLHSVYVIRHSDHTLYTFPCNKWLGMATTVDGTDSVAVDVVGKPCKVLREEDFEVDP